MTGHTNPKMSRREFVKLAGLGLAAAGAGSMLAACAPAPARAGLTAHRGPRRNRCSCRHSRPATAVPAAAGGKSLKMWWWGEQEAPGLEKWLAESVDMWTQQTGNSLEKTLQDNASVITEFQTASAANNAPDIQFMWNGIYHMESTWLGYVEPLDALFKGDTLTGSGATKLSIYQGKQYRIGWYNASPMWLYNKEMFDKAGLNADEPPTTWDALLDACDKLKSKGFIPLAGGLKDGPWGEWWMGHALTPQLDSPADAINLFIGDLDWREPRYHEQWSKLKILWDSEFFNDDFLSVDLYPGIDMFGAGKGAMTAIVVPLLAKQASLLGSEKVGAMVFPTSGVGKMNNRPIQDSQGFGISSQSKVKEAAADFLASLHTEERVNALHKQTGVLPTDSFWDGATQIQDPLFKAVWKNWQANPEAVPYISNLMPVLFWTDAMFVNSQKVVGGEWDGAECGDNAYEVTKKWKEQNPDMVEHYRVWADDLKLS